MLSFHRLATRPVAPVVQAPARRWAPVIVACLPLLALAVLNAVTASADRPSGSDFAILELTTRDALGGDAALGPYSRFGWHHPGPALFYWFAPFYALSGQHAGGLAVAALVLNLACVATVVGVTLALAGRAAGWTAAAVVIAFSAGLGADVLQSPWNPDLIIWPLAALGVLGAAVAAGSRWALPVAALLASFVVQTHVAAAPVVAGLAVPALAVLVTHARQDHHPPRRPWAAPLAVTAVVLVVLWAPVVVEQLTGDPGNLTKLAEFFVVGGGAGAGDEAAWDDVRPALAVSLAPVRHLEPLVVDPLAFQLPLAIGLVVGTGVAVLDAVRRRRRFSAVLAGGALTGIAASVLAGGAVRGDPSLYLFSAATGIAVPAWLALAHTGVAAVQRSLRRPPVWVPKLDRVLAGGVTTAAVLTTAFAVARGPWNAGASGFAVNSPDVAMAGAAVLEELEATPGCGPGGAGCSVLVTYEEQWFTGAGLVNQLDRQGIDVSVDAYNDHVYGPGGEHQPTGDEDLVVVVGPAGEPPPERGEGAEPLSEGPRSAVHRVG